MMKKAFLVVGLLALATLLMPQGAYAGGLLQGRVIFGGDFTLAAGEEMDGDLVVMGGTVTLERDSLVRGDVVVMGGSVVCDGEVRGDLVAIGGQVELGDRAVVGGDVQVLGGALKRAQGAVIKGRVRSQEDFAFQWELPLVTTIGPRFPSGRLAFFSTSLQILFFIFRTFMVAALAVLVVMFWPEPVRRVAEATVSQPLITGGLGLLTLVLTPAVLLVLVFTLIGIPVALVAVLLLAVAILVGWIALGQEVGRRLGEMLRWDLHPAAAAGLGTLLLSLVVGGIGFIPCIGWMAPLVVMMLGLGGVLVTRLGTQEWTLSPATAAEKKPPARKRTTRKKKEG